jgi:hypothetical protein
VLAALVAGCSAVGEIKVAQPKTAPIRPGASVALNVDARAPDDDAEDVANGILEARKELFAALPASGMFSQVRQPGEPADYRMDVHLTGVRIIGGAARIWGGALAGRNEITAEVEVTDEASQQLVTRYTATGSSASHPFSTEDGFDAAVRTFGNQVTDGLR